LAEGEVPAGFEAHRLWRLAREAGTLIHVSAGEGRAEDVARAFASMDPEAEVILLPPWDCLPYDWASPTAAAMGRRMAALRRLAAPAGPRRVVVTSPLAILQRLPPRGAARSLVLRVGDPFDPEALARFCEETGYRADDRVDEPGEVAIRGGAADIYPAGRTNPRRLAFGEGRLAAIRRYDPVTQRSDREEEELILDPATELPAPPTEDEARGAEHWLPEAWPELAALTDHLPDAALSAGPGALRAAQAALSQIAAGYRERERNPSGRRPLPPERLYLSRNDWAALRESRTFHGLTGSGWRPVPVFAAEDRPRIALSAFLRDEAAAGRRVLFAEADPRLRARLARRAAEAAGRELPEADWAEAAAKPKGTPGVVAAAIDRGFVDEDARLAVVTLREALGSRAALATGGRAVQPFDAEELHEGDLVIHHEHGLARLAGLEPLAGDMGGEAIRLQFAEGESLLLPADQAGAIWRYAGPEADMAPDRLGGSGWPRRRARAAQALAATARAMLAEAAARDAREGRRLVPDRADYETLCEGFGHDLTPDQVTAIRDVLSDLASGRPMDRLVVGDVGYGKTEVAIRAAAAAALAGAQVAIVAPTTVLARQHHDSFRRRFDACGLAVGHLSRLVPAAEARRVRQGLADGSLRVVVGTHALLGKGVAFADLGLVVVDEEQRLGAAHKRRLRELARGGHRLTLTATPIPRTLRQALAGLQSLSVIATAPARRRPIRTLLGPDADATLREALLRERRRGGQSFVVVPRVEDIAPTAERLRAALPRLDLKIAHGGLPAREIDEAMVAFGSGEGDVLLATSIIESGLDVPRANTMAVLRPDLFGLAQLHQLRGRVGRGAAQAYCLLLTRADAKLSEAAMRRLGTLQTLDRLGAGMAISAMDLDLRGAGDLFGEAQTGHAALLGLPLAREMLAAALRQARGEPSEPPEPELRIDAPGDIPADYIPEPAVRLDLYIRLARVHEPADARRLAREVEDRFGPPPPPMRSLLDAALVRALARGLGVARVSAGPEAVALDFHADRGPPPSVLEAAGALADLEWMDGRLVRRIASGPEARVQIALALLEDIA
jgi:transcription-repair coupling factor (superfamily II helicase)